MMEDPEIRSISLSDDSESEPTENFGNSGRNSSPEISVASSADISRTVRLSSFNTSRDSSRLSSTKSTSEDSTTEDNLEKTPKKMKTFTVTPQNSQNSNRKKTKKTAEKNEEKLKKEEEKKIREEKKKEETRLKEEQKKKREEERLQKEAELKQRQEEREKERKRKEEEKEAERKKKEEERLKKEKEKEEEVKRKTEEKMRKEAEKKKHEDERNERNEQKRLKEEERLRKEAEEAAIEEKKARLLAKQQNLMKSFVVAKPKPVRQTIEGSEMAAFEAYEIQPGVRLAPRLRVAPPPSPTKLTAFLNNEFNLERNNLYLGQLRAGLFRPRTSAATCSGPSSVDEVTILSSPRGPPQGAGEVKVKLIQFSENSRPPFYGTMRRKSRVISGRNPFRPDEDLLEYDVDSDEEWEEDQEADECEDETKSEDDDEEDKDDWLVPDEDVTVNNTSVDALTDDEEDIRPVRSSVADWQNQQRILRLTQKIVGPFWNDFEKECPKMLKKLRIIPVLQNIEDVLMTADCHDDLTFGINKIPENIMPYFIRLLHGSVAKKRVIAERFVELFEAKNTNDFLQRHPNFGHAFLSLLNNSPRPKDLSKNTIMSVIQTIAEWQKPEKTQKTEKNQKTEKTKNSEKNEKNFEKSEKTSARKCWFVKEKVRQFYKVLEGSSLPNPEALPGAEKRKASEMEGAEPPAKVLKVATPTTPKVTTPKFRPLDDFFLREREEKRESVEIVVLDLTEQ